MLRCRPYILAKLCEASGSPDCGVGEKTQHDKNGQCDEHPDYDRRTIRLRRTEHVECPKGPDRDQGDADREQGRGDQPAKRFN